MSLTYLFERISSVEWCHIASELQLICWTPFYITHIFQVHAKHEEKSDNRSVYREYNREFLLPKGTNPEHIRSSLSKDGVLTVEAPLPALENREADRRIPIQHK